MKITKYRYVLQGFEESFKKYIFLGSNKLIFYSHLNIDSNPFL